jgi:hypothetical protein
MCPELPIPSTDKKKEDKGTKGHHALLQDSSWLVFYSCDFRETSKNKCKYDSFLLQCVKPT